MLFFMQSSEIRQKFLDFFKGRNHAIIPSSPIIPENDPTALFVSAGMQPLVPYLLGETHPSGNRITDVQKCVRTDDIDEVGDEVHHTFFEMLGNWSLGDYFKKEAIEYSWEFLTSREWMGIDKNQIAVSVFAGNDDAPFDAESYDVWIELGVKPERIRRLPKKNNWWETGGDSGPCGPDTEMFIWTGDNVAPEQFDPEDNKWVEVWNDVFMQYNKVGKGKYEKLSRQNVDTGMGLERMTAVMNGVADNYQTDLFIPIINKIEELSTKKYLDDVKSFRIIADHLRAAVFIIGDDNGVTPSNTLQGYVLRRLIRRAIRYGRKLEVIEGFSERVAEVVIETYKNTYPELEKNRDKIIYELNKEEMKFDKSLAEGLKILQKIQKNKKPLEKDLFDKIMVLDTKTKKDVLKKIHNNKGIEDQLPKIGIPVTNQAILDAYVTGEEAFDLFQSYGFPIEMIIELVQENDLFVDIEGFREEFEKHQALSRTASAGMFKGGLADTGEETTKLHTAAHLLLASLRQVLGSEYGEIMQKGSNITAERLRFDFNYPQKLTEEQLKKVEELVNEKITAKIPVEMMELSLDDAKNIGATGAFGSKYGERVRVYKINDFSFEICGGPHVTNTKELGHFKITKEESSSSGVRRIKAIVE